MACILAILVKDAGAGWICGHESPILEELPPAEATAEIQSVAVAQVEPEEHPPVTQAEGEQYA